MAPLLVCLLLNLPHFVVVVVVATTISNGQIEGARHCLVDECRRCNISRWFSNGQFNHSLMEESKNGQEVRSIFLCRHFPVRRSFAISVFIYFFFTLVFYLGGNKFDTLTYVIVLKRRERRPLHAALRCNFMDQRLCFAARMSEYLRERATISRRSTHFGLLLATLA